MQLTKQQFHKNLVSTLKEVVQKDFAGGEGKCRFVVVPVYEQSAKHSSLDDYMRLALLNDDNVKGRLFDLEGATSLLSGPNSSYPLWVNVLLKKHDAEGYLFELEFSTRFRKPSELKNNETGHPPFKAIQ